MGFKVSPTLQQFELESAIILEDLAWRVRTEVGRQGLTKGWPKAALGRESGGLNQQRRPLMLRQK